MAYLVLARKYRPRTFEEVVEQEAVTRTLSNAVIANRVAHAVLFTGPRGTGKTTIARILAKAMNCEQGPTPTPCNQCRSCREITAGNATDVFEIDGASNNSVDQIRELRGNIKFMPAHSPYKIYIIDEVHMLSASAFNALLKTLEEPPAHVLFFFATTEPHKIPATILSRCQRHDLAYINPEAIVNHLESLCRKENRRIERAGLEMITREAGGSMRDALSLLDQAMNCATGDISHDQLLDMLGIMNRESVYHLSSALIDGAAGRIMTIIDETYSSGLDIKKFYLAIMDHFRNLLMVKLGIDADTLPSLAAQDINRLKAQVQDISAEFISRMLSFLLDQEERIKFSARPKIAVELAFLKITQIPPTLPVDTLIEKIDSLKNRLLELEGPAAHPPNDNPALSDHTAAPFSRPTPTSLKPTADKTTLPPRADTGLTATGLSTSSPPKNADAPEALKSSGAKGPPEYADTADAWEQILSQIDHQYPLLAASLINSTLSRIEDGKIEIEIYGSRINLDIVRQEKHYQTLKKICTEFFQADINITITHKLDTAGDRQAPAQKPGPRRHPLVAEALGIFGGDIVNS